MHGGRRAPAIVAEGLCAAVWSVPVWSHPPPPQFAAAGYNEREVFEILGIRAVAKAKAKPKAKPKPKAKAKARAVLRGWSWPHVASASALPPRVAGGGGAGHGSSRVVSITTCPPSPPQGCVFGRWPLSHGGMGAAVVVDCLFVCLGKRLWFWPAPVAAVLLAGVG